jgi:hypothetical protein
MGWLGTWSKRLKFTIDQTKVDTANQSNFPVLVYLSTASGIAPVDVSCIFDELTSDANRKKIAVTTSDGTTQCYVEIADWDDASEVAWLWVKVPTVTHAVDTDLFIYFDSSQADNTTYVGDIGSTPGQTVWDSDFISVFHFEEKTGVLKDSTSNGHDGTTVGFSEAERTNTGKIGNAFDFNEAEWISLPDHADFKPDLVTVEAVCKTGVAGVGNAYPRIFDRYEHPTTGYNLAAGDPNGKGQIEFRLTGGEQRTALTAAVIENDGSWHSLAGSYEDNHTKMYDDGDLDNDTVGGAGKVIVHKAVQVPYIGCGAIHDKPYKGLICEFRISKITRSAPWIKVTYHSNEDDLMNFGGQETIYTGDITVTLLPESLCAFNRLYTGDVTITFSPESLCAFNRLYTGDVTITFSPESSYGILKHTGDVTVNLTPESSYFTNFLYTGDVSLTLTPEALIDALIDDYEVTGSGGVEISGAGDFEFITPDIYELIGSGGVEIGGEGIVEFPDWLIGSGGVRISGSGDIAFEAPDIYELVGSGGVEVSGEGIITFEIPPIFELAGSGGVKISGEGIVDFPEWLIGSGGVKISGEGIITFEVSSTFELIGSGGVEISGKGIVEYVLPPIFELIGSGGVKISGEGISSFETPGIFELMGSGGVEISGEGDVVFLYPDIFALVGSGGVGISGSGILELLVYHTWVITGPTFEPSIYSNFDFNAYSKYRGKCYGLKSDGLYILEGEDDNGSEIHTGINLGPRNFGKEGRNKLRSIQFGVRDGDNINVKVSSKVGETYSDLSRGKKAMISRSMYGDDLDVFIADFEKLGSLEFSVIYRK